MKLDSIVHPSDFTFGDEPAFAHALRIALSARARIDLFHVKKEGEQVEWSDFPHVRSKLVQWGLLPNDATREQVAALGLHVAKSQQTSVDSVKGITDYVDRHQPDLVVLSTHQRHGLDRWLHDSMAEPVARQTPAATLFVPRKGTGFVNTESGAVTLRTVLVPVDSSPNPQAAVDAAERLGRTLGCEKLHFILLHIGTESNKPRIHLPAVAGWTSEYQVFAGNVVDLILTSAQVDQPRPDLIVMATHGKRGFLDALRGSSSKHVLHGTPCPLLAVPANS